MKRIKHMMLLEALEAVVREFKPGEFGTCESVFGDGDECICGYDGVMKALVDIDTYKREMIEKVEGYQTPTEAVETQAKEEAISRGEDAMKAVKAELRAEMKDEVEKLKAKFSPKRKGTR